MNKMWFALVAAVGAGALYTVVTMRASGDGDGAESQMYVYVCTDTEEVIAAPAQATPAINPGTGKRTLLRALYCSECAIWIPTAPSAIDSGNPLRTHCSTHGTPLSITGPLPDVATVSADN